MPFRINHIAPSLHKVIPSSHLYYVHSNFCSINLLDVTPSLISLNCREWMLLVYLTPYCHVSLPYIMDFDIKINHQRIQSTHTHKHHIVIIVIIVIIAMLTLSLLQLHMLHHFSFITFPC
jgi:hypothetical protein